MSGAGSWILPNSVDCEDFALCEPDVIPPQCVILYSECDFTGASTRICDDTPFTDFDYEV